MEKNKKKKVIVALSGGIDSSVAAALLKKVGFSLVGIFMRFWPETQYKSWNRCCSPEAEKRARLIAAQLKIPFYVLDLEKEFKKRIIDYFLRGYKEGKTPNPCVVCNKEIKFGLLLEKALTLGADFVATGHYARLRREIRNPKYRLLRAKDKEKDQSYFLWMLNQEKLSKILFPIGDYKKEETKNLAKKFDLPVLDIPESQELCFIEKNVNDFLKKHLKRIKSGKIVNLEGKILGEHSGLPFYTTGQRKGIKLPGGPFYVLDKDLKENLLIVTKNEKDLYKKELVAENVNWLSGREPNFPLKVKAKIRYRQELVPAIIKKQKTCLRQGFGGQAQNKDQILVKFQKPQRAITSGQSVVFYKGEEVLGGGIIQG